MRLLNLLALFFLFTKTYGQSYTSYFTGNNIDVVSEPEGGICLMGGATEDDRAMTWFLERANGGDVLVIRASGSNGYNDYLYSELGVGINSVETIVFNSAAASTDAYVLERLSKAEAIWLAGGDQWNYVSYWRNSAVDSIINDGIVNRNIVIGGTSAGMAVMGKYYFSAQNGSMTSAEGLADPYNIYASVDSTDFFHNDILHDVITDTHFDDPDRKGRMVSFLARIITDYGVVGKGIACDEYTAVCIDTEGIARVYGEYPESDDNAYFIQPNCEIEVMGPEQCSIGSPLIWNRGGQALKIYKIKGTWNGVENSFNLNDWQTGTGGVWEHWSVNNGVLSDAVGLEINCNSVAIDDVNSFNMVDVYPNPTNALLNVEANETISDVIIMTSDGRTIKQLINVGSNRIGIDLNELPKGLYIAFIRTNMNVVQRRFIRS